jgi:hypothetical protein
LQRGRFAKEFQPPLRTRKEREQKKEKKKKKNIEKNHGNHSFRLTELGTHQAKLFRNTLDLFLQSNSVLEKKTGNTQKRHYLSLLCTGATFSFVVATGS